MIVLEKLREEDLPLILKWRKKEEYLSGKIDSQYNDQNLDFQKAWFDNIEKNEKCMYWVIKIGAIKIGIADLNYIDYEDKNCGMECIIGDSHFKNRGIKPIVISNLYEYAFNQLNLNEVCRTVKSNEEEIYDFEKNNIIDIKISRNIKNLKCIKIKKFEWEKIRLDYFKEKINIQ